MKYGEVTFTLFLEPPSVFHAIENEFQEIFSAVIIQNEFQEIFSNVIILYFKLVQFSSSRPLFRFPLTAISGLQTRMLVFLCLIVLDQNMIKLTQWKFYANVLSLICLEGYDGARWREETSESTPILAIKNINANKVYSFEQHLIVFLNAQLVLCVTIYIELTYVPFKKQKFSNYQIHPQKITESSSSKLNLHITVMVSLSLRNWKTMFTIIGECVR